MKINRSWFTHTTSVPLHTAQYERNKYIAFYLLKKFDTILIKQDLFVCFDTILQFNQKGKGFVGTSVAQSKQH